MVTTIHREQGFKGLKEPNLSGNILQLTTNIKYLGLILDEGLTWKGQLKNVVRLTGLSGLVRAHLVNPGV
jgi:hypothetical protein